MTMPTSIEKAAHDMAGAAGGEHIMRQLAGKTDMSKWTPAQWDGFIRTVCIAYADAMVKSTAPAWPQLGDAEIPF